MSPQVYADLLFDKVKKHDVKVWLVNTGWTGGRYGIGKVNNLFIFRESVSKILKILLTQYMKERLRIMIWILSQFSIFNFQNILKELIALF